MNNDVLKNDYETIVDRKNNPKEGSYTNYLLNEGIDKILKKVGEECTEVIIASKNTDNDELVFEISDLLYHLTVLMVEKNVTWDDVYSLIKKRTLKEGNLKTPKHVRDNKI